MAGTNRPSLAFLNRTSTASTATDPFNGGCAWVRLGVRGCAMRLHLTESQDSVLPPYATTAWDLTHGPSVTYPAGLSVDDQTNFPGSFRRVLTDCECAPSSKR